jgi:hypothetical protein
MAGKVGTIGHCTPGFSCFAYTSAASSTNFRIFPPLSHADSPISNGLALDSGLLIEWRSSRFALLGVVSLGSSSAPHIAGHFYFGNYTTRDRRNFVRTTHKKVFDNENLSVYVGNITEKGGGPV